LPDMPGLIPDIRIWLVGDIRSIRFIEREVTARSKRPFMRPSEF